jgi:hypothetical protein
MTGSGKNYNDDDDDDDDDYDASLGIRSVMYRWWNDRCHV